MPTVNVEASELFHSVSIVPFLIGVTVWVVSRYRKGRIRQELPAMVGSDSYYLCMNGNADGCKENEDEGEWNIIIEKKCSLGQRLRG